MALGLLLASGEAIAALGTGTHAYIATGHLWSLLSGTQLPPETEGLALRLYALPAWTAAALLGGILALIFRSRTPKRKRLFARH